MSDTSLQDYTKSVKRWTYTRAIRKKTSLAKKVMKKVKRVTQRKKHSFGRTLSGQCMERSESDLM